MNNDSECARPVSRLILNLITVLLNELIRHPRRCPFKSALINGVVKIYLGCNGSTNLSKWSLSYKMWRIMFGSYCFVCWCWYPLRVLNRNFEYLVQKVGGVPSKTLLFGSQFINQRHWVKFQVELPPPLPTAPY